MSTRTKRNIKKSTLATNVKLALNTKDDVVVVYWPGSSKIYAKRTTGEQLKGDHITKIAAREYSNDWTAEDWTSFESFAIKTLR